jgi:DNA (cytosine-5)-methyltransferase 1
MTRKDTRLTAIDVFSGCGGLTTGLKRSGFEVITAIEQAEAPSQAFRLNHPDVPVLQTDVRNVRAATLMDALSIEKGQLDLLAGCSPCQGFSRMRTRNHRIAAKDDRNDLILEFARLAAGLRPRVVLIENVPGLAHDPRFRQLATALRSLGYDVAYSVLDLSEFGIPQRRKRLIVIASRVGPIPLPHGHADPGTVRSAIGHLPSPRESSDPIHRSVTSHSTRIARKIAKVPRNGGSRADLGPRQQLQCHKRLRGFWDVYGRMAWDRPSPTITRFSTNPSKGRYLHPTQNRAITLREAALLQTLPSRYRFPLKRFGRGAVASMIGEALPPVFAAQVGRWIKRHILSQMEP